MTPSEGVMLRIIAGMLESLAGWMDGYPRIVVVGLY